MKCHAYANCFAPPPKKNPIPSLYRKDLKDLFAKGDTDVPIPKALSRVLRPAMLGVFAQKPQMYTLGIVRRVILIHFPWSHISHDSLTRDNY